MIPEWRTSTDSTKMSQTRSEEGNVAVCVRNRASDEAAGLE